MEPVAVITKKRAYTYIIILSVLSFIVGAYIFSEEYDELSDAGISSSCNVLAFTVNGYLSTYTPNNPDDYEVDISSSDYIVDGILVAQDDPDIKAVLLSIDSFGGDGVAGEEIANALKILEKPNVAVIRGIGASSAYWMATGADKIFASRISDVGSIGVTASYLDETIKNTREGLTYVELASAPYKDTGTASKTLTSTERAIMIADLKKIHDVFVDDVVKNRGLERSEVEKLANGLTYTGLDALEYGLIDEIGDLMSATKYLEKQIGEKAELCWY